jgi:hypothetical protein
MPETNISKYNLLEWNGAGGGLFSFNMKQGDGIGAVV